MQRDNTCVRPAPTRNRTCTLGSQLVPQSVGAKNPSWNLVAPVSERVVALLHGPFVLVHCWNTLGLVGTRLESFAFSFGLGVASKTLRYDAATAVCAATADDADAEAQAASTRTVVETEEGFSFDVASGRPQFALEVPK